MTELPNPTGNVHPGPAAARASLVHARLRARASRRSSRVERLETHASLAAAMAAAVEPAQQPRETAPVVDRERPIRRNRRQRERPLGNAVASGGRRAQGPRTTFEGSLRS